MPFIIPPLKAFALLLLSTVCSTAQERPYQLVCFEEAGITASLDQIVNAQQFLRNDRILQSGSCSFVQIPAGSTARYVDIHASPEGFLYPIYQVIYASTGQRMYAADGVFSADQWLVRRQRGTEISVLVPQSCDVLDGFTRATTRVPRYVLIPEICEVEIVE